MSLPVKTLLMNAIKSDLESIKMVQTVVINPVVLPKPDTGQSWPILCVSDEPEAITKVNVVQRCKFSLWIEGWQWTDKEFDMSADQDELKAQIEMVMLNTNSSYRQYCIKVDQISFERHFENMNMHAIISKYELYYQYLYGNPYQLNIS